MRLSSDSITKYIIIIICICILLCLTLIGNGIACSVTPNPNLTQCYYIVYGSITLMVVFSVIALTIYIIKLYIKKNNNHLFQTTEPRIVLFENRTMSNSLRINSFGRPNSPGIKSRQSSNIIISPSTKVTA